MAGIRLLAPPFVICSKLVFADSAVSMNSKYIDQYLPIVMSSYSKVSASKVPAFFASGILH